MWLARRPLCSWRPAGGRRDDSHVLVSLQLGKLHDVQGASRLQDTPVPRGARREQLVASQVLEALLLPAVCQGCCCCCWTKQGPAGTHSRDGGLAAARCDGPGCLEMWELGGGSEGFTLLGGFEGIRGGLSQCLGGHLSWGSGTRRMAERVTGEGKALSQMKMLDCCL